MIPTRPPAVSIGHVMSLFCCDSCHAACFAVHGESVSSLKSAKSQGMPRAWNAVCGWRWISHFSCLPSRCGKGKPTGNSHDWREKPWFPVEFPSNQARTTKRSPGISGIGDLLLQSQRHRLKTNSRFAEFWAQKMRCWNLKIGWFRRASPGFWKIQLCYNYMSNNDKVWTSLTNKIKFIHVHINFPVCFLHVSWGVPRRS